jgi:phosphatidylglycerol:prolipoprotein diacylglycerol transferase
MLYLGAVFGVIGGTQWAAVHGLVTAKVHAAMLLLFLPALVGARLLFVAFHWKVYRRQPSRIWRRADGGAALYGGLIVSLLASLPLLRALAIHPWAFWDAAAVAMLIGMVFAKVGCLLHGCCAGRPTESLLALYLPNSQGVWRRRLPTQLFEAGLAALLLLCSFMVSGRLPFEGSFFLCALAAYGGGRWMLETTRETIDRIGQWSLNRTISASFVVLATMVLLLKWILGSPAATVGH